jgi:excisionase family DNA binding protein
MAAQVTGIRIVETTDGPALQIPAGAASRTAASILRLLQARPDWAGPDRETELLRRFLLEVERRHANGDGYASPPASIEWVTAGEVAESYGVTAQFIYRLCRDGRIPGAEKHRGRWRVPAAQIEPAA